MPNEDVVATPPQTPPPPTPMSPIDSKSEDADGKNAWNFGS